MSDAFLGVLLIEVESVYCAVRTESLCKPHIVFKALMILLQPHKLHRHQMRFKDFQDFSWVEGAKWVLHIWRCWLIVVNLTALSVAQIVWRRIIGWLTLTSPTSSYTRQCSALRQAQCRTQTDTWLYKLLCNFPKFLPYKASLWNLNIRNFV
jgi:hypothetical protein